MRSDPVTRVVHGAAPTLYALVARGDHEDLERLWQRARDGFDELPDPGETADSLREAVTDRLDDDRE